jgi:hypothetical protein
MKRIILLAGLFALCQITYAQCDKLVTFKCNKARDFKNDSVNQELPVHATLSFRHGLFNMTATFNGETETVKGEIKEILTCDWEHYLKNGKTKYKVLAAKGDEDPTNAIIEIESKNGNTKITISSDPGTDSKLQFDVAEYSIEGDKT